MTIACPDCGALADIPPLPPRSKAICRLCRRDLETTSGRSITAAFACSFATFLLLFPSYTLPLISVDVMGMHAQSMIGDALATLWDRHWILISGPAALFVIILPVICFGLLSLVLGCLRFGYRPAWLGRAFRWAMWIAPWSMPDVFLLASFVGYYRLSHLDLAHISIEAGGACFMAAGFLTMLSRATLDRRSVWRRLGPGIAAVRATGDTLSCTTCDLVQPLSREGRACPRCGARLRTRKLDSMPRTAALVIGGFILFLPANLLPMNISNQLGNPVSYTIFKGVSDLFENGLWPLGALVFCTSILIPFGKLVVLAWCMLSVRRRTGARLRAKTKIFALVAELGRWSKTDPFTIVFFVPLINFGALASARAGWGAAAFMMMSILTMFASGTFDPRLMWDAAPAGPA